MLPHEYPLVTLAGESYSTGRRGKRHRHTRYSADDGGEVIITRHHDRTALVTVIGADGARREFRESLAGTDTWLLSSVGYRLGGA
nr:MAG TPA: hypothetical protein [Caudoviricetes sp.]